MMSRLAWAVIMGLTGAVGCSGSESSPAAAKVPEPPAPRCGDGMVQSDEVCDDGNVLDGDSCPSTCLAVCGDGFIHKDEACDDGNTIAGDGCTNCQLPGTVAWNNIGSACHGHMHVSPDGLLSVVCPDPGNKILERYSLDGKLVSSVSNIVADANEGSLHVFDIVERDGYLYVAMEVIRAADVNATAYQPRTRIAKYDASNSLVWQQDVTTFPGGRWEYPKGIAVNASGQVAVVGSSQVDFGDDAVYAALLSSTGQVTWKYEATLDGAIERGVVINDAGNVFITTRSDYDSAQKSYTTNRVVAFNGTGAIAWERRLAGQPNATGGAVGQSLTMTTAGDVQLVYIQYLEDPLVPNPPKTTASVRLGEFNQGTGDLQVDKLIASTSMDAISWTALASTAPLALAQDAKYLACQWNRGNSITGLTQDGQVPWTVSLDSATKWLTDLLAYKYLVCASYTTNASPGGLLYCYYAG